MKPLKWITDKEKSDYMRRMRDINLRLAEINTNENLVSSKLGQGWSRQVIKGYRIFDFWNHSLGCAIEVDGPEHDREYDNYRDEYNFRRSGIIILRVRNRNIEDWQEVSRVISKLEAHQDRKSYLGIAGNTKLIRRSLSSLPYERDNLLFVNYLLTRYQHNPYWR